MKPSLEERHSSHEPAKASETNRGKRLNLGCGADAHPAFVNVDAVSAPGVVVHDLRRGIPFPDQTFDLVYHARMVSRFRPAEAALLMQECHRVLKPGGVLRAVTEDLEQMCRIYLEKLEAACDGDALAAEDYEWMILEIYDQATRETPGGGMAEYLSRIPLPNEKFIFSRTGTYGRYMVSKFQDRARASAEPSGTSPRRPLSRLRGAVRRLVLEALIGPNGLQALELGRFKLAPGQVTYRMYDRYSLGRLFATAGLTDIAVKTPGESGYAAWAEMNLDIAPDGSMAKPSALIMEGRRAS